MWDVLVREWWSLKQLLKFKHIFFYILKVIMIKECYIRMLLQQQENEHVILLWRHEICGGVVHYTQPGKNILGGKFIVFQSTYLILNIFHIFHVDTISFFPFTYTFFSARPLLFISFTISHIYATFSYAMQNNIDFNHT